MAITKLVLDRQAAGRVFTFGSSAASADVNLAKSSGDSANKVLLTSEGSVDVKGGLKVTGSISVNGGLNVNNQIIANVSGPVSENDAANKYYVDDKVSNISGSLSSRIAGTEADILIVEEDISTLQSSTSAIQGDVTALQGDVSSLQGDVSSLQGDISTIAGDVSSLQGDVSSLQGDVSGLQVSVSSLETSQSLYAKVSGGNSFSGNQTFGNNVVISGNLTVNGTQTIVDTTQVNIGDNIISLNGSQASFGGIEVTDATAPSLASGSLLWDSENDVWIAGVKGSEKAVLIADLGTSGQVLTMVSGAAVFAAVEVATSFKRASISGNVDGSNKTFTVTSGNNFVSSSEQVILNGIILMPGASNDYTLSSGTLEFTSAFPAPISGDNLQIFCTY